MSEENKQDDFDFLNADYTGFENTDQNDLKKPYITILQPGSPAVIPGKKEFIPGASAGMLMNSLTKEVFTSPFRVIFLHREKLWMEYTYHEKRQERKFVGVRLPESIEVDKTDFTTWRRFDNGNVISEVHNWYVLRAGKEFEGPCILSFSSSGIAHSRNIYNDLINNIFPNGKRAPMYGGVYELKLELNEWETGNSFAFGVGKRTNCERTSWVERSVYEEYIKPAINLIQNKLPIKMLESTKISSNVKDDEPLAF